MLASGEVVEVDKDRHPDLFWALRGAFHSAPDDELHAFNSRADQHPLRSSLGSRRRRRSVWDRARVKAQAAPDEQGGLHASRRRPSLERALPFLLSSGASPQSLQVQTDLFTLSPLQADAAISKFLKWAKTVDEDTFGGLAFDRNPEGEQIVLHWGTFPPTRFLSLHLEHG